MIVRTSAIERAEDDLQQGDYGLARQRLTSYLSNQGYNADVLARIGRISYDMHDLFQAGRYWLLSSAEGDDVEDAVAQFVRNSGDEPRSIVSQLPRAARLPRLEDYPGVVQDRLRRLGLAEAVPTPARKGSSGSPDKWKERAEITGCLLVVLVLGSVFLIGLGTVVHWLFWD